MHWLSFHSFSPLKRYCPLLCCPSAPHISPHLHCQHLTTSVTNYLNALVKQFGRQEGRKCVRFCRSVCLTELT